MGSVNLNGIMDASNDLEMIMSWHLQSNHYPPVPADMIPICLAAVDHGIADEWDEMISLPSGTLYKGQESAPVWAIVAAHHLDAFIQSALEEDQNAE